MINFVVLCGIAMNNPTEIIDLDGNRTINFVLCTSDQWVGGDWNHREHTEKHIISVPKKEFDKDIAKGDCVYLVGRMSVVKRINEKTGLIAKLTEISTDFYDIITLETSN